MKNHEATETTQAAAVAEQGAPVAPAKAASKKAATQKKGAPKGQKTAKGAKAKAAAPKKAAKAAKKAAKPERKASRPARREQGREDPGHDRPRQGRDPRRDHEGHRLAGPQRQGFHLHRRQEAQHQHRVLEERSGRPRLQNRQVETPLLPSPPPGSTIRRRFSFMLLVRMTLREAVDFLSQLA